MRYTLAIEFGGVYTSIYRKEEGLVLKEPSLVCAKQDGEGYTILAMGNEAKKMQGKTDDKTYIFSPFGEGKIKAPEYAVELLNYFLKKVEAKKLIKVTEESFFKGLEFAKIGNRLTDISHEIQRYVEVSGFSVVREFVGHGIGISPNPADRNSGVISVMYLIM